MQGSARPSKQGWAAHPVLLQLSKVHHGWLGGLELADQVQLAMRAADEGREIRVVGDVRHPRGLQGKGRIFKRRLVANLPRRVDI